MVKTDKAYQSIITVFLILMICVSSHGEDLIFNARELIQNGGFENRTYTCHVMENCSDSYSQAQTGRKSLELAPTVTNPSLFYQPITLPTELHHAKISFEILGEEISKAFKYPVSIKVGFAIFKNDQFLEIGLIGSDKFNQAVEWGRLEETLKPSLIDILQKWRERGQRIFLFIYATSGTYNRGFYIYIDNLSLKVDGIQKIPAMRGKIAYLKKIDSSSNAIHIIDPNDRTETVPWSLAGKVSVTPIDSVSWKPDGTELAFISGHEFLYSPFYSDVYAIKPNGEGMRKVTNRPSQEEILKGNYPRIKVKGKIVNHTGRQDCHNIFIALEGAPGVKHIRTCTDYEVIPFEIDGVALIGNDKIFGQKLIFYWNNTECYAGLKFTGTSVIVKKSVADLGEISFYLNKCLKVIGTHTFHEVTWKYDGSEIGFRSLSKFESVKSLGDRLIGENVALKGSLMGDFRWSPVDDRILFTEYVPTSRECIAMAQEGGTVEQYVCSRLNTHPTWLPDGSGFVFILGGPKNKILCHYDIANREKTDLIEFYDENIQNPSVSPSGNFIVFERYGGNGSPDSCDLWILDRRNTNDLWPLTNSGMCFKPDWSRADIYIEEKRETIKKSKREPKMKSSNITKEKITKKNGCFIGLISSFICGPY